MDGLTGYGRAVQRALGPDYKIESESVYRDYNHGLIHRLKISSADKTKYTAQYMTPVADIDEAALKTAQSLRECKW